MTDHGVEPSAGPGAAVAARSDGLPGRGSAAGPGREPGVGPPGTRLLGAGGPRVVLTGPPGAGKSTVARLVGKLLDEPFTDVDEEVERESGRSIADLFIEDGEAAFRVLERQVCARLLRASPSLPMVSLTAQSAERFAQPAPRGVAGGLLSGVLSLGGGAVLDPDTQVDLRDLVRRAGIVVFLDVGIADASRRVGFDRSRPLLSVNPRARWTEMMNARRPVYQRVSTVQVDTAGRSPEQVAADVVDAVRARIDATGPGDAPGPGDATPAVSVEGER
ncbi:MAG: shikimate kinase [Angustibacter sp.]